MVRRADLIELAARAERVRMTTGGSTPAERPSVFQQFAQAGRATGYYRSYQGTRQYDQLQIRNLTLRDSAGARLVDAIVLAAVPGRGVVIRWGSDYADSLWDNWRWNSINRIADNIVLQRSLVRGMVRDGESFMTARMGRDRALFLDSRSPVTLRTDSGIWYQGMDGTWKQGGITFGPDLVPEIYDFTAPGSDLLYQPTNAIPALYPGQLTIHLFSQDFEFQTRGLSWLLPALTALEEYADNVQDISQMLKLMGEMSYAVLLDADYTPDEAVEIEIEGETRYQRMERLIATGSRALGVFPPGAKIQEYPQPPAVQAGLPEILKFHEARLARAVGISQHTYSGSQSDANLSSIRAGEAQNMMVYERAQHLLTMAMHRVAQVFWEHYTLADPQFRREVPYFQPEIIPPGNSGIDYRDRQVDLAEAEKKLTPYSTIWRRRGLDPEEVMAELKKEQEFFDSLKPEPEPAPAQGQGTDPVPDPEEDPDGNNS